MLKTQASCVNQLKEKQGIYVKTQESYVNQLKYKQGRNVKTQGSYTKHKEAIFNQSK